MSLIHIQILGYIYGIYVAIICSLTVMAISLIAQWLDIPVDEDLFNGQD